MDNLDTSLMIQAGAFTGVGVIAGTRILVDYFKGLFSMTGNRVKYLTLFLSLYAVITAMCNVLYPLLGYLFMGVYFTCLLATLIDAQYLQQRKAAQDADYLDGR